MSQLIFLNGTSSSGKSTLAKEIQRRASIPFWHVASDQLVEAGMLPLRTNDGSAFDWNINRPKFFNAFHACIKAILDAGNPIILDHIIESVAWYQELQTILAKHEVFFVGVHCPLSIIQQREKQRSDRDVGNRYIGEAEYHLQHVHSYANYDYEVDTSIGTVAENAAQVLTAWSTRRYKSRFFATHG